SRVRRFVPSQRVPTVPLRCAHGPPPKRHGRGHRHTPTAGLLRSLGRPSGEEPDRVINSRSGLVCSGRLSLPAGGDRGGGCGGICARGCPTATWRSCWPSEVSRLIT